MQAAAVPATGRRLMILALGLVAFIFDTVGGVLFAKLLNLFLKEEDQPDGRRGGHFRVPDVVARCA